jgi:hypothetical protein
MIKPMLKIDYGCCIHQFLVENHCSNLFIKHTTPFEHFVIQIVILICQVWKYVVQFYTTHPNNISTTFTKSHTNISRAYANAMSAWITSKIVMIEVSPMTTWISKKDSRFFFVFFGLHYSNHCSFSCHKILYFVQGFYKGDNIEIHPIFAL